MNASTHPSRLLATLVLIAGAFLTGEAAAAAPSGAIFTTDINSNVNVNQYPTKEDVYLNGGPLPPAPCTAAGLPDGVYVFQITNPAGTVPLSTDPITAREFTVSGGVIIAANSHPTVTGVCPGALAVQMAPFDDTPNNGGVYKAWVTLKSDFLSSGGKFVQSKTKTDNFRVEQPAAPETASISVYKFYDANANGIWDGTEKPLFGWAMQVTATGFSASGLTQSPDGLVTFTGLDLAKNPYAVAEGIATSTLGGTWVQSASIIDGVNTSTPQNPVTGLTLVANHTTEVDFGNYCYCPSNGKKPYYWGNIYGQNRMNDGGTMVPEFKQLNNLHLRLPSGGNFNLDLLQPESTNYSILQSWLLNADGTNMAYLLSVQLAAMRLSSEAGYVRLANFYIPYGGTIAQLVQDANDALAIDGLTPVGDPNRALQEELEGYLAALNNNADVVKDRPCEFNFVQN